MRARSTSSGVFALGLALSSAARADPKAGPPVHIMLRDCPQIAEREVERVLAAELGSEPGPQDGAADPTFIVATCTGPRVVIEVTDPISRKTLRRSFDLSQSSSARSRLIAIAASELVLAGWAELALRPPLRVQPEGAAPRAERARAAARRARQREADVERSAPAADALGAEADAEARARRQSWLTLQIPARRRFRVVPLASMRRFITQDGALWGGGVRVGEEPLTNASWAIDALFESGNFKAKGDSYRVDSWSLGALIFLHARTGPLSLRAGGGLRGGLVAADAADNGANRTAIPWGWPLLALDFTLGEQVLFELSAEGSYAVLPVTPTSLGVSVRGVWVAVQVGVGLAP